MPLCDICGYVSENVYNFILSFRIMIYRGNFLYSQYSTCNYISPLSWTYCNIGTVVCHKQKCTYIQNHR